MVLLIVPVLHSLKTTAYDKSKDLAKRTQSDKVLRDNAFKIPSDSKYDGYQRGLASSIYHAQLICLVNMRGLFL